MAQDPHTQLIYDLFNPHFRNAEILTKENKIISGQFVRFKVVQGDVEYVYPAEKYCFLPFEHRDAFWDVYNLHKGVFNSFPEYILQLGLNDISIIMITPLLIT